MKGESITKKWKLYATIHLKKMKGEHHKKNQDSKRLAGTDCLQNTLRNMGNSPRTAEEYVGHNRVN